LALAFAAPPHQVEQAFNFGVVGNHVTGLADVDQVIWMQTVLLVDVDALVNVTLA
jgi:hypothetical protein